MSTTRKVGWEDQSITGGRRGGPDKERRYRGKKGETHVIRVMTDCNEFRQHSVDDVLEPDKDGEARVFQINCRKVWDEKAEDWSGSCECCDERDYDLSGKFISGILLVGVYKGRSTTAQKIDPEHSPLWWDFGPDKYRQLSDIALELSRSSKKRKLSQVELTVKCEDEHFQKLNINVSQADTLTTKAHIDEWRSEGEKLLEEATAGPTEAEMKRNLKKKKSKKRDNDDEDDDRSSKKRSSGSSKKKRDDDEETSKSDDTGDEDLDDLLAEL